MEEITNDANMSEIIGGYIQDDIEKAQYVLDYIDNTNNNVKNYVKKIIIGGIALFLLGMVMMFMVSGFMMSIMYIGLAVILFGAGMFLQNFLHMRSIKTPTIIRKEAIDYIKKDDIE